MNESISIKEAARRLGIRSEKTIRRMVRCGELRPLPRKGGQGVPYEFDQAEVDRYARNETGAVLLARCLFGFVHGRIGRDMRRLDVWAREAANPFPFRIEGNSRIYRGGSAALPHVAHPPYRIGNRILMSEGEYVRYYADGRQQRSPSYVTEDFLIWARAVAVALTRREVECLCALCVASAHPEQTLEADSVAAHRNFWCRVSDVLSTMPKDRAEVAIALLTAARDAGDFEEMLRVFREYFPADAFPEFANRADASRLGPMRAVIAETKRARMVQRRTGQPPSAAEVGRVLRIGRAQAGQLLKSAFGKLKQRGLWKFLQDNGPVKPERERRSSRPLADGIEHCPVFRSPLAVDSDRCPVCRAFIM